MKRLLGDVEALGRMLEAGGFDEEHRIGAELEMFLIGDTLGPACVGPAVLKAANDPRLTPELAQFNLEANATPLLFRGSCLRDLQAELVELVGLVEQAARTQNARVVLAGILPTLQARHLGVENMTDLPRYHRLNETISAMRGGEFRVAIEGADELEVTHDNVMMESANTSFQLHFQVAPQEFAQLYNIAQAATAPVLASAVNSPLFLGRRLWSETRIALFRRSVDHRRGVHHARQASPRVCFGADWVQESVLEVFREQIARYRSIVAASVEEDSLATLAAGKTPELMALRTHNGTIYRWNRACYGVADGVPHLRIENRALPSGPTIPDQVANAAFFFGLLSGYLSQGVDFAKQMPFEIAKTNFFAAARRGLGAQLTWLDGKTRPVAQAIAEELLPLARHGLESSSIDAADIDRYLGIIESRLDVGRTGASWMIDSMAGMPSVVTVDARQRALTAALYDNQQSGKLLHEWPLASADDQPLRSSYRTVEQFMSRKLFTTRPSDLVNLAACLMDWEHIKHVPVEDEQGRLVGLVTYRRLLRLLTSGQGSDNDTRVEEIMEPEPHTVEPGTKTLEAMRLMRDKKVSCLPVVSEGKLVGIVTERDLIEASMHLLEKFLKES